MSVMYYVIECNIVIIKLYYGIYQISLFNTFSWQHLFDIELFV